MWCWMKNSRTVLICLTRFRRRTETTMMNILRSLITTQMLWILSMKNSKQILLVFSNGSQMNKEKGFKSCLSRRLRQHRLNLRKKRWRNGRTRRMQRKGNKQKRTRRRQLIQRAERRQHLPREKEERTTNLTLMCQSLKFHKLWSTHQQWRRSSFMKDQWTKSQRNWWSQHLQRKRRTTKTPTKEKKRQLQIQQLNKRKKTEVKLQQVLEKKKKEKKMKRRKKRNGLPMSLKMISLIKQKWSHQKTQRVKTWWFQISY